MKRDLTLPILLVVTVAFILLDSQGLLSIPKGIASLATTPLQYTLASLKRNLERTFSLLTFWHSGEERVKYLEQRNIELTLYRQRHAQLERENATLRLQIGARSKNEAVNTDSQPAVVLGRSKYLQVAAGTAQNVQVGSAVSYLDNLIGRVVRVDPKVSFIALPFDQEAKIPAKIGIIRGLVSGQFNNSIIMTEISQNEDVKVGDLVATSGEGQTYPPNLIIGKVSAVSDSHPIFKEAKVQPLVNYDQLEFVFLLSP